MTSKIINVTSESFKSEVEDFQGSVMIDFWAPWCPPCKAIAPFINDIAEHEFVKVCKVNIDEEPALSEQFTISSIPRILYFVNGKLKETIVGAVSKKKMLDTLARVEKVSV